MGARPKLLFVLELPFLIFHGGVALIVGNEFRKGNRDFVTSFNILYLAQSAVDCLAYVATGLVGYDLMPHHMYYGAWSNFNLSFCGWCTAFQVLSHVLVAFNRYTAIVIPHRHTLIWKHKNIAFMLLGISLIAFLSIFLRVIDKVAVTEVPDGVLISSATAWMRTFGRVSFIVLTLGCTFLCFALEIRTVVVFRRFSMQNRLRYRDDFRLLVYALFQFVVQFFLTMCYLFMTLEQTVSVPVFSKSYPYLVDLMSLSSSPVLFSTRQVRRLL